MTAPNIRRGLPPFTAPDFGGFAVGMVTVGARATSARDRSRQSSA
jgi:hypothetical protein